MRKQKQQATTTYTFTVMCWTLISVSTHRSLPFVPSRILIM
ncbi:MAG TPA: hypothetical protein VIZ18_12840 [Ktedonobacteraceae bacterium]